MGRKKKKKVEMHSLDLVCYVCKKQIRTTKYYSIGKNFAGESLYRHTRCKPGKLSTKDLKQRKIWTRKPGTIVEKDKRRKNRQQQKINLKKKQYEN